MYQLINYNYINSNLKGKRFKIKRRLKKSEAVKRKCSTEEFQKTMGVVEKEQGISENNKTKLVKHKMKDIKQFLTFAFVGTVNTSLEIITMNFLWWITGLYKGNINYLFKFIALIICSVVGFLMNKKLTFKSESGTKSYVKYAVIFSVLSFIEAVMIAEFTKINVTFVSIAIWANLVSFFASATTGIANFAISKFFVFNDEKKNLVVRDIDS